MDRYKNTKILSCLCNLTYVPCIAHHDILIFFCKQTKQIPATSCLGHTQCRVILGTIQSRNFAHIIAAGHSETTALLLLEKEQPKTKQNPHKV